MIAIKNLTKKYKNHTVLNNVTYTFPNNGLVCLLGASGSGKTTLFNLLAGFDTDYEGQIKVSNSNLREMNDNELATYRWNNIGFIFQNYHLLKGYTVAENILLASRNKRNDTNCMNDTLKFLGINEKKNEKIENLSGGQKQRVAIARALLGNPEIIFADEPTGALDRKTSDEIMELLKEISKTHLVVVITHDEKVCEYADEILHINDGKLESEYNVSYEEVVFKALDKKKVKKNRMLPHAIKNFKVNSKRFCFVSFAICLGVIAFLISLSFRNVISTSINDFKEKNTAFNNGFIKDSSDEVLKVLKENNRVEDAYYQYILPNIKFTIDGVTNKMEEKVPTPKTAESLSYGVMPRKGYEEISISPSLAKKFSNHIQDLIGKELVLEIEETSYILTVSGIHNAGYDDFFVSSDIEKEWYQKLNLSEIFSISYDVKGFEDVVKVYNDLKEQGILAVTAEQEVASFLKMFSNLNLLFLTIALLILCISLLLCVILLVKLQNTRLREIGLLSALGFTHNEIITMLLQENILLASLSAMSGVILLFFTSRITKMIHYPFHLSMEQTVICVIVTFIIVVIIGVGASIKLIHTEPSDALRG